MAVSARTLITNALVDSGISASGVTIDGDDGQRCLKILNREIMDAWNAQRYFATHRVITSGSFAASTSTRTVGPTGSYVLNPRPDEILQANWVDSAGFRRPISIRDADWYVEQGTPTQTGSQISDIAYFPTVPNGTMYPVPIPDTAQTVELETRSVLTQFSALDSTADLAPGYENAIHHTLKEPFCMAFEKPMPIDFPENARKARRIVMGPHMTAPRIDTRPY